jgi:Uma2 family endonuclease
MEDLVLEWQVQFNNGLPEGVEMPPTEDELPYSDGRPMESQKHALQMTLLIQTLSNYFSEQGRADVAVHGNMAVYYSIEQAEAQNFRAPDFFVVLGAKERHTLRKSWVIWQEGRAPNLVIELLSESTKKADRGIKKQIYQDAMRVPEYIMHDVVSNTFEAFRLVKTNGDAHLHYEYIPPVVTPTFEAVFLSHELGLELVLWEGEFEYNWDFWLRWRNPETGELLPTGREVARQHYKRAEQESLRAEQESLRAEQESLRAEQESLRAEQESLRAEQESQRAEQESLRAEQESLRAQEASLRAEQEHERAERLAEKLRALGINPDVV